MDNSDDPDFDGSTYDRGIDHASLRSNLDAIRDEMLRDRSWRTADAIATAAGVDPRAAVKERIRDLRKPKFGGYNVESDRSPDNHRVWIYRIVGQPTTAALVTEAVNALTGIEKGIALIEEKFPVARRPQEVQDILDLARSMLRSETSHDDEEFPDE